MKNHKQWVSEIFDRAAPHYGTESCSFFNYFGKRLVEQVNVLPGQHVLDVATGRGAVLFPVAEAVGPLGKVAGIDISEQMLKDTAAEIHDRNWIQLQQMDAENLDFPDDSFDFVFCGFALFFFPSISRALSEFKRVLKTCGQLVVSTWGKESELKAWINDETKKLSATSSLIATPLWSGEELRSHLEDCFNEIQIFEETKTFFHKHSQAWWDSIWNHGTRAKFEQLTSTQLASLRDKALAKANSIAIEKGVPENLQVFYGIAKKG